MNLFTNPTDMLIILIIMLVVAGPKRMIQWAYTLGRYTAQIRVMLQETMNAVQKEIDEAGLDIRKDLPTIPSGRFDLMSEVAKVINTPVTTNEGAGSNSPTQASTQSATQPSETAQATPKDGQSEQPRYDAWLPK